MNRHRSPCALALAPNGAPLRHRDRYAELRAQREDGREERGAPSPCTATRGCASNTFSRTLSKPGTPLMAFITSRRFWVRLIVDVRGLPGRAPHRTSEAHKDAEDTDGSPSVCAPPRPAPHALPRSRTDVPRDRARTRCTALPAPAAPASTAQARGLPPSPAR